MKTSTQNSNEILLTGKEKENYINKNFNTTTEYNNLLNLCIQQHKVKGVIQKSILDILSKVENQSDFLNFVNSQIRDKVFTDKIAKFQNNLNQKSTQELHFNIGEDDSLTQTIGLVRDPKSTEKQANRPYILMIKEVKEKKVKTLEEQIKAFKAKMAKEFNAELSITLAK
jgi:hypothetical protein